MSGIYLPSAISNAEFNLPRGIKAMLRGPLAPPSLIHDICTYFRQRGVARMLIEGVPDGYHVNTMQSAAAFLFELRRTAEPEKVTSFMRPIFDAVSSGYWDVALAICGASRRTWNSDQEYEDDFLYALGWIQLLEGAAQAELDATIAAYGRVLDGKPDLRFDLLRALAARDAAEFDVSLRAFLDKRKREADEMAAANQIPVDTAAWVQNFALEGVALLKLAERLGIATGKDYLHCPEIVRPDSPFVFDPNAWRSAAFSPMRRPVP